ncbi:phosphoketolase [Aerococcus christensenii]|uniref:Phosphoketolase n=1 Tax=Aerococcus christensenii TaxID=87541 RepID=A0A109RCD9_9LACT|nr:phosphoketolase family protein [Aerococcus christensenii]AMB92484.1 phosphoketolase [Aerococcus christensenii]PKY91038.1 phosphoketolase [Aerococcus christensenii]
MNFDSEDYLKKVDAWWRAANYICVGQLYMKDNPLLSRPIRKEDIKVKPIGHWGTIPAGNFIYAHLNRLINKYDLNMMYIVGPGHGGPVMNTNAYLDGSYTEIYPDVTQDIQGMRKFFKEFSFPGGVGSHAAPETPGSIHEGGELGYSISHAVGAILDNPNLIAVPFIGDGEAETGPLMTSWLSNAFINPVNDGAVLPIINLNGAKISNPTLLSRKTDEELTLLFKGFGWDPIFIEGDDPVLMHHLAASKLDEAIEKIKVIQNQSRMKKADEVSLQHWPMIILRTPKGWTGIHKLENKVVEGSFRAHQIPLPVSQNDLSYVEELEKWLKSYKPNELFTKEGKLIPELKEIAPKGNKRMAKNPATNGGIDPKVIKLPNWEKFGLTIQKPGEMVSQDMINLGSYVAEIIKENPTNFRVFGPDETASNRLQNIFNVTNRQWLESINNETDEFISPAGRVIDSQLSEHQAQGFLEGYVLTGRYGFYASYESFLRITDSMMTQFFKWIRKANKFSWRKHPKALNIISASTVFQQDHNGYTHQDPGVLTHLADKKGEFIREYLPADTNSLLAVMRKTLASENCINLIVASKHPRPQFYTIEEAKELVEVGYKVIPWASSIKNNESPDIVIATCGTEPNLEGLATVSILNKAFPKLKIKFINIVDLLKLRHPDIDTRGISNQVFNELFTVNKPIIFTFHGYEGLIRDIFYNRENRNLHIHGYREEGDITTPFDMRVFSEMDRFHLAKEAAQLVYGEKAESFIQTMDDYLAYHYNYIRENGADIPEVENWKWEAISQ